jgi:hypothetical protein
MANSRVTINAPSCLPEKLDRRSRGIYKRRFLHLEVS